MLSTRASRTFAHLGGGIFWLVLLVTAPARGEQFASFDDFLRQYRATTGPARAALARSYVEWRQAHGGLPIASSDGSALFVYLGRGHEKSVRLVGDFRPRSFHNVYWDQAGDALTRAVDGGELFFKRMRLESDARIDYLFAVDGRHETDRLNPHVIPSGVAPPPATQPVAVVSELAMPGYRRPAEAIARSGVAKGTLHETRELPGCPRTTVYLPPAYNRAIRYSVVYTADGASWIKYVAFPTILDNLIAEHAIEPVMAVMIDPNDDRGSWYYFNPEYLSCLRRAVAFVDGHYSTRPGAANRLHVGSSAGGRAVLFAGLERPTLFRNLALLSPSLSGPPYFYEPYFSGRKRPDPGLRVWLSAGSYEGSIHRDTRTVSKYLENAGLAVKTVYTHEGHSFGAWRRAAAEMLKHFFPAGSRPKEKPAQ